MNQLTVLVLIVGAFLAGKADLLQLPTAAARPSYKADGQAAAAAYLGIRSELPDPTIAPDYTPDADTVPAREASAVRPAGCDCERCECADCSCGEVVTLASAGGCPGGVCTLAERRPVAAAVARPLVRVARVPAQMVRRYQPVRNVGRFFYNRRPVRRLLGRVIFGRR